MNVKNTLLSLLFVFTVFNSFAQEVFPSKWNFSISEKEVKVGDKLNLLFESKIPDGFYMYSSDFECDLGPLVANFDFELKDVKLIGKIKPINPHKYVDDLFGCEVSTFKKKAHFEQQIEIIGENPEVKCYIEYQNCSNETGQCVIFTENGQFKFNLKNNKVELENEGEFIDTNKVILDSTIIENEEVFTETNSEVIIENTDSEDSQSSLWWIFWIGFGGGILALLTPCVWPMIPMTVSFFLKQSNDKKKGILNAIIYGVSIIVIYVGLGLGVTLIFGADAMNYMSTTATFNLILFALLVLFAASFFGAFELTLPSSWANKLDAKADKTGGLIGIFLMALVLAVVSFSCTGPIIGGLLFEAISSGIKGPLFGMLGFSVALAIPFSLFAIFPSMMNSMPKSGGWLNSVKVVLGFLELALALKFLSVADLTQHWRILDREVFLVLWIIIFALLGFYLLGKLKFSHDSDVKYVSVPRLFLAIISFSFAVYMIPGLWGAPLKAISAFAPEKHTQDFDLAPPSVKVKSHDYYEALKMAKAQNKPLMVDFTGHGCVNCRKMEEYVWPDKKVASLINDKYILVSLYVDDRQILPKERQRVAMIGGKEKRIKTVGDEWMVLQSEKFGKLAQPYYVLLDNNEKLLVEGRAFDLDINEYVDFLNRGLVEFNKRK